MNFIGQTSPEPIDLPCAWDRALATWTTIRLIVESAGREPHALRQHTAALGQQLPLSQMTRNIAAINVVQTLDFCNHQGAPPYLRRCERHRSVPQKHKNEREALQAARRRYANDRDGS